MKVGSDPKRKSRYWVEDDGKVLFESDDASEAIQRAVDHLQHVEVNATTGTVIEGKRKPKRREAVQ